MRGQMIPYNQRAQCRARKLKNGDGLFSKMAVVCRSLVINTSVSLPCEQFTFAVGSVYAIVLNCGSFMFQLSCV